MRRVCGFVSIAIDCSEKLQVEFRLIFIILTNHEKARGFNLDWFELPSLIMKGLKFGSGLVGLPSLIIKSLKF